MEETLKLVKTDVLSLKQDDILGEVLSLMQQLQVAQMSSIEAVKRLEASTAAYGPPTKRPLSSHKKAKGKPEVQDPFKKEASYQTLGDVMRSQRMLNALDACSNVSSVAPSTCTHFWKDG